MRAHNGRFPKYFLSKSKVVRGKTSTSKSVGTFDDEKIDVAHQAKDMCPTFVITITEQ